MSRHAVAADREGAERWFRHHGLPWFVDAEQERVSGLLRPRAMGRRAVLALLAAAVVGVPAGWWVGSVSTGLAVTLTVAGLLLVGWAVRRLDLGTVGRWAVTRTLRQLGLLVPLATRALPLLLIFTVTLFVNTEVWQVAALLPPGVLWLTVLLFTAVAGLFLTARMPEEVQAVVDQVHGDGLAPALRGTPFADRADELAGTVEAAPLSRLQRTNLHVVLLVVQSGQVLLLAAAVWAFFVLFGAVAIRPQTVETWIGRPPRAIGWDGASVSVELLQVSVFLAAFSGLYFTVYAITDETYRRQFFTHITTELEHAVGVRAVYRALAGRAA